MYPPTEQPDLKYCRPTLDKKFYPDDAYSLHNLVVLDKPPMEVSDAHLFDVANSNEFHLFWRCCAAVELISRQGVNNETLQTVHSVFRSCKAALQLKLISTLSEYIRQDSNKSENLSQQVVQSFIASLKNVDDYRLLRFCWLLRWQLGERDLANEILTKFKDHGWKNPEKFIDRLEAGDCKWSLFAVQKPLSLKIAIAYMPAISPPGPFQVTCAYGQKGKRLLREVTSVLELESDDCVLEMPALRSGVYEESLVEIGEFIRTGSALYSFYPHQE